MRSGSILGCVLAVVVACGGSAPTGQVPVAEPPTERGQGLKERPEGRPWLLVTVRLRTTETRVRAGTHCWLEEPRRCASRNLPMDASVEPEGLWTCEGACGPEAVASFLTERLGEDPDYASDGFVEVFLDRDAPPRELVASWVTSFERRGVPRERIRLYGLGTPPDLKVDLWPRDRPPAAPRPPAPPQVVLDCQVVAAPELQRAAGRYRGQLQYCVGVGVKRGLAPQGAILLEASVTGGVVVPKRPDGRAAVDELTRCMEAELGRWVFDEDLEGPMVHDCQWSTVAP